MSTVVLLAPPNQTNLAIPPREARRARGDLEQAAPERTGDWFLFGSALDLPAFVTAVRAATRGLSPTGHGERAELLHLPRWAARG